MKKSPEGLGEREQSNQNDWEQKVANMQQELDGLSPEEQLDAYVDAMAEHNIITKKAMEGGKGAPVEEDVDNARDKAMILATLIKKNDSMSPEKILKRIEEKTKEGLES